MKLSFSLTGYTSHEARLSLNPYFSDPVVVALRDYAAAHPKAVKRSAGGLERVDAWYDTALSTPRYPVLASARDQGWFLVEPSLLKADGGVDGFFVECPARAGGGECIRHHEIADRSVEVAMTDVDLQHWAESDVALRIALQSILAPCMS